MNSHHRKRPTKKEKGGIKVAITNSERESASSVVAVFKKRGNEF